MTCWVLAPQRTYFDWPVAPVSSSTFSRSESGQGRDQPEQACWLEANLGFGIALVLLAPTHAVAKHFAIPDAASSLDLKHLRRLSNEEVFGIACPSGSPLRYVR